MKGKIFNAQEVQAIIAGNKTMFREVIKNKTSFEDFLQTREVGDNWYKDRTISMRGQGGLWGDYTLERFVEKFCPYKVGQKIKPKPKSGSIDLQLRLFGIELLIKKIRVERLADISEEDIKLEGFKTDYKILPHGIFKKDAIKFFIENWNATHKKPEEKFEANPFVWVVDFKINK